MGFIFSGQCFYKCKMLKEFSQRCGVLLKPISNCTSLRNLSSIKTCAVLSRSTSSSNSYSLSKIALCNKSLDLTPSKLYANAYHTSSVLCAKNKGGNPFNTPEKWLTYNDVVYSPREKSLPRRPAEIFHQRANIKYSYKKLWYTAVMIRGMPVDEAIKQLNFHLRQGSLVIRDVLLEAQEIAVRDHNVEFKSNLFVADSFVGKAHTVKGMRKHGRMRFGVIHYRYTHYFVCLREGPPPKNYYAPKHQTGNEHIKEYIS